MKQKVVELQGEIDVATVKKFQYLSLNNWYNK